MFTISREYSFEASHAHGSEKHPLGSLHGHSWRIEVYLSAEHLDAYGYLIDERELERFGHYLMTYFQEKHLNDFLEQPTPAVLAKKLYGVLKERWPDYGISINVSDTQASWASYTEETKHG